MRERRSADVQRYLRTKSQRAHDLLHPLAVAIKRRHKLGVALSDYRKESIFHQGLAKLLKRILLADATIVSLNKEHLSIYKDQSRAKNFLRKKRQ